MAAIPLIAFCREKKALADLFVDATRELLALHQAEAEALTQGISLDRFELAIKRARDKKDKIKLAYQLHRRKTDAESRAIQDLINFQPPTLRR